jgi:hypothetical protein
MFSTHLTLDSRKTVFASKATSLQDVESAVRAAQAKYNSAKTTKARKWLNCVAARLMHYRNVFDTLAQQQPEYVSLAWGAMKFMLVVSPLRANFS